MSGLKYKQKLWLETLVQKRYVFGILPNGFGEESYFFKIATGSTDRLAETRMCLCLSIRQRKEKPMRATVRSFELTPSSVRDE